MADADILEVEGAERHLSDGQRRSEIRLEHLSFAPGQVRALCGPSGIGKTTALEMLSLARAPDIAGRMVLRTPDRSVDLHGLVDRNGREALCAIRGRYFGYVVQSAHLFPFLTVRENIALAQRISGRHDRGFLDRLMDQLQISSLAASLPTRLSGGQRQRVCVARALAHRPLIVLADEPTSSVDREVANRIMSLLTAYALETNAAVLVITHDVDLVESFGLAGLKVESNASQGLLRTVIADRAIASTTVAATGGG